MHDEILDARQIQSLIATRIERLQGISAELPSYLALIEAAAEGGEVDREAVLRATGLILDNLYRGVLSPRLSVPRDFWASPVGLMIARAHTHVVRDHEVMSQAEAAQELGISREYVSQMVEAGKVKTIVRDAPAPRSRRQPREMIYRDDLPALKRQLKSEDRKAVPASDGT